MADRIVSGGGENGGLYLHYPDSRRHAQATDRREVQTSDAVQPC